MYMTELTGLVISLLYICALGSIFAYTLVQAHLLWRRYRWPRPASARPSSHYPSVTVQIPLYNEGPIGLRLVEAVCQLDWPGVLEVQVLDDSDDGGAIWMCQEVERLRVLGRRIVFLHRPHRQGFKAGALAEGTRQAQGDFMAIFDADFVPPSDFLLRAMPFFDDPRVGVVQGRWGHLNQDQNLLTKVQALGLDAHFGIEQPARSDSGLWLNFNGTAGIWRKTCIREAGGWRSASLAEDLDLSYRAQLAGWGIRYVGDIVVPAELPALPSAVRAQQHRWVKGAAECARLLLREVWQAPLPWTTRLHATAHLLNSTVYLPMLVAALLAVPVVWVRAETGGQWWWTLSGLFVMGYPVLVCYYGYAFWGRGGGFWAFAGRLPALMAFTLGLSLHNTAAVLEGWTGRRSSFVRTPKGARMQAKAPGGWLPAESLLTVYFLGGCLLAWQVGDWWMLPYLALLTAAFGWTTAMQLREWKDFLKAKNRLSSNPEHHAPNPLPPPQRRAETVRPSC